MSHCRALAGHIPEELGALSKLQKLHLWENKLTGAGVLTFDPGTIIFRTYVQRMRTQD